MHFLGQTRSTNRRDHLLLTPDTFVRTPLPGLSGGLAIVHVCPAGGAAFTQMTVELDAGGTLSEGPVQRLAYVLAGELTLDVSAAQSHRLGAGSYAYLPSGTAHTLTAQAPSRVVIIEKPYMPLSSQQAHGSSPEAQGSGGEDKPGLLVGHEADLPAAALNGDEGLQVRSLLPPSMAFDFACNTMTYAPGAALSQVEIHYMEHGLLMLEGGGIYRLGESWYPVSAGDFIWMAPFCPQWFGALGKAPAKYLIYKDFNRHPLTR